MLKNLSLSLLCSEREAEISKVLLKLDKFIWSRWVLFSITWNNALNVALFLSWKKKMSLRCKFSVLPVELRPFSLAGALEGCSCCHLVKPRELLFFQPHFQPCFRHLIRINSVVRSLFWDQHAQQSPFLPQSHFSCHNVRKIAKNIWARKYTNSAILEAYF